MAQSVDVSLQTIPIPDEVKAQIASVFWGVTWTSKDIADRAAELEPFFAHYFEQTTIASHEAGRYVSVQSHKDIITIVQDMRSHFPRDVILTRLRTASAVQDPNQQSSTYEVSIDFAARLLTMVEIGRIPSSYAGRKPLLWTNGTLQDLLHSKFSVEGRLARERVKLENLFNGRNLDRISVIKIRRTTNLADHLRDDSEVAVFNCITFLRKMEGRWGSNNNFSPFHGLMIIEAICFPQHSLRRR